MAVGFDLATALRRLALTGALLARGAGAAQASTLQTAPAITIDVLLDNSPSMEIGATPGDIAAMMYLTPCSVPGAIHGPGYGGMSASGQTYSAYQCGKNHAYDGQLPPFKEQACPIPVVRGVAGPGLLTIPGISGPRCTNLPAEMSRNGTPVLAGAGAPCAFACHWDRRNPPDAALDYYGVARSTIGQAPCYQHGSTPGACAITLRTDLVKNAVARLINTMHEKNDSGVARFAVGVFTFDETVHAIYPLPGVCGARGSAPCQAGQDWALALGSVGTAPDVANTLDAGIQPFAGRNEGATDLPGALSTLARDYLTASASDAPNAAVKALFIVTDGLDDHMEGGTRRLGAIDPNSCRLYKSLGFDVFVLYTPYYPLMNPFYFAYVSAFAEGDAPGSLRYNLRVCASDPVRNFIEASPTDAASISEGLQSFLSRVQH